MNRLTFPAPRSPQFIDVSFYIGPHPMRARSLAAAGFSYLELTLSVVAGSAALAGAYQGYRLMVNRYDAGRSDREGREAGYAALEFIASDVRMAGRMAYDDEAGAMFAPPARAVTVTPKITGRCCDTLEVIYDKSATERVRVTYYGALRGGTHDPERYALYADTDLYLGSDQWSTLNENMFLADYVESFDVVPRMQTASGSMTLADLELTLRAEKPGSFTYVFAAPAYAGAENPPAAQDRYPRRWFSKTVALRNMEKY